MKRLANLKEDSILFSLVGAAVLFIWYIVSDFSISDYIGRNDATSGLIWVLQKLREQSIDSYAYDPGLMGGYPTGHAIGLMWPLLPILKWTSISVPVIHNFLVIFTQMILAYFGLKWSGAQKLNKQTFVMIFPTVAFLAFAPVLGWRIAYGHMNLILGAGSLITIIYLVKTFNENTISILDCILATWMLSVTLNFVSFQPVIYILYLLLPFLLLTLGIRRSLALLKNKYLIAYVIFFFILNIYFILPFYEYYLSGSGSRSTSINIFGYAPPTFITLFSSALWENNFLQLDPVHFKWHELHYPIGVGLAAPLIIENKKKRYIAFGLLIVLAMTLLQVPIITDVFKSLPLISKLRVPQRILIMVALLLMLLFTRSVYQKMMTPVFSKKNVGLFLTLFLGCQVLTGALTGFQDILMLGAAAAFFIGLQKKNTWLTLTAVFLLSFSSVRSFYSHFLPKIKIKALEDFVIKRKEFPVKNPFERSYLDFSYDEVHTNTAYALGIPSLDGYFYAPARFSELIHNLHGIPVDPTFLGWRFKKDTGISRLLANLFNIRNSISIDPEFEISKNEIDHDGIIFPSEIIFTDDINLIVLNLFGKWDIAHLASTEEQSSKDLEPCAKSVIKGSFDGSFLVLEGVTAEQCLIIIPTNYASSLYVEGVGVQRLLPANHALLGMIIGPGKVSGKLKSRF